MSGIFRNFFNTQQSKKFEPRYRYYDEREERIEKMKAKHEEPDSKEAYRSRLRAEFSRHRRVSGNQNANLRVILIAGILFLLVAYLYF